MSDPQVLLQPDDLVGRSAELEPIWAALDGVAGVGRAFHVVGDPGVGKSALLAAVAAEGRRRGLQVVVAAGHDAERHLPFAALHQMLRPLFPAMASLSEDQRAALSAAFGPEPVAGHTVDALAISLAVLELVAEVSARRPLVLVVDDAQWLDAASRETLLFVGRRIAAEQVVMVSAARRTTENPPASTPSWTTIDLRPLSRDQSEALLRRRSPDLPAGARRVVLDVAAGNPLALVELPSSIGASHSAVAVHDSLGPITLTARLEDTFVGRVADLSPGVAQLLLVTALLDSARVSEAVAAARLLGSPGAELSYGPAVDAHLVDIDGDRVRFQHPLVRSAIMQRASGDERRAGHEAVAEVLTADPDRAAWHRSLATVHSDEAIAAALVTGAEHALDRGAPAIAQQWLQRAAELSEEPRRRGHRLLRAAELAFELGRAASVRRLMADAQSLPLDPPDRARLAGLEGAFDDGIPGDLNLVRRLTAAADEAHGAGNDEVAAHLLLGAAMTCYWGAAEPATLGLVRASTARLHLPAEDARLVMLDALADPFDEGASVVERLIEWTRHDTPDPAVASALGRAGFVSADFDRAALFAQRASEAFRRQGRLALLAQTLVLEAFSSLYLGRWDVTLVASGEAQRFAVETDQPVWAACAALGLANLAAIRGRRAEAEATALEVERTALMAGNRSLLNGVQLVRGHAALGAGAPDEAFAALRRMMDPDDDAYQSPQMVFAIDVYADAAMASGNRDEARQTLAVVDEHVGTTIASGALRAMSLAHALLDDDELLETRFAKARAHTAAASPWHRARLDLAHGAWMRRHQQVAAARPMLRRAQTLFDALGAGAWATRAAAELAASGERRPRQEPDAWSRLSAQELQIAQLAASGLSNREIGARLYLSHRTVGSHLYRLFPKLGISKRSQLHLVLGDDTSGPDPEPAAAVQRDHSATNPTT